MLNMKKFGNILWGLVFVIVGIIWGVNALGIAEINIFFKGWWTLFIIIPSFIGLFTERNKLGNIIGLFIGCVLLACAQGLISFSMIWKLLIPTVFVIIGLTFIFKDVIGSKVNKEIKKLNANRKDGTEYCATFASQNINYDGQEFEGADLTAVFGSVKCNLVKANITEDQVINASSIFGGIEILVPTNVNIKIKSTPIFGGVSDKSVKNSSPDAPTIYINAYCMFGGVDIK